MPELDIQEDVFYKGYRMPLFYEQDADLTGSAAAEKRYRCIVVTGGNGSLTVNGFKKIFVSPAILCLNESEIIDSVDSQKYSAGVFYFHPEIVNSRFSYEFVNKQDHELSMTENQDIFCLRPYFEKAIKDKIFIQAGVAGQPRLIELIKKVCAEISNLTHPYWPCATRSYFLEFLFYVKQLESRGQIVAPEVSDDEIDRILLYINTNYQDKITIEEITRRFETNRTTLSKKFQSVTGNSVISYLNKYRVNIAAMLLRDTSLPVNDIMYRVGFNDPTHFGKTFARICGMTPSSYRKNHSWLQ